MKNEKTRRILMTVCGITLNGIAVGLFNFSDFGMDPFQVFAHGLWNLTSIGFGTFYMMLSLILLAAMFFMDRSKIGLAAAFYFTADLGVSTYDVIALHLYARTRFPFQYLRIATDVICVVIGFSLHTTVGIGTLVTAFFMGPVITFFRRHVSEPLRYGKKRAARA